MGVRNAGRVMKALFNGLNDATFTPLAAIEADEVVSEETESLDRVVRVIGSMGYAEVRLGADGKPELRLTESGVAHKAYFNEIEVR